MSEQTTEWSTLWLEAQEEIRQLNRQLLERSVRIADLEQELHWALTGDMPARSSDREIAHET